MLVSVKAVFQTLMCNPFISVLLLISNSNIYIHFLGVCGLENEGPIGVLLCYSNGQSIQG